MKKVRIIRKIKDSDYSTEALDTLLVNMKADLALKLVRDLNIGTDYSIKLNSFIDHSKEGFVTIELVADVQYPVRVNRRISPQLSWRSV